MPSIKGWLKWQVVVWNSLLAICKGLWLKIYFDLAKQKPRYLPYRFVIIVLVASALGLPTADATNLGVTPRLAVRGAYDDNILFTEKDKTDSSIVTVSPSLELDYKTLLSSVSLMGDWDIKRYIDESDFDRTNQYYRLRANHNIENRLDAGADFRFYRDTTLNTYLQETGRVVDLVERDYLYAGGRVAYDVTMLSGISARYRYQKADYDSNAYSDYDNHRANLYYYHRLKSQVDKLSIGPSYYHRENDYNTVDSYTIDIGWDRDWSQTLNSALSIGARYSDISRDDGTSDDSWGVKANFDMKFEGEVSTTKIEYNHDIRTTTDGDDINVDNFLVTYNRMLTERFGAGVNGRIVFSYKLFDQQADIDDSRYYRIEPHLFYRLTEHLRMSLYYRYQNNVKFQNDGDKTRERNVVWLRVSYGLPFFL